MWRVLLLASTPAIPLVCDPAPEPPAYECKTLPAEVDFGEVETFMRKEQLFDLDHRDRPELSMLAEPFSTRLVTRPSLQLAIDFTPTDSRLHLQELRVRLSPLCEEQTLRLSGLGSGALETPNVDLEIGVLRVGQSVDFSVPLTNTRRVATMVRSFSTGPNRMEITPGAFTLQPAERREIAVRLTCAREGVLADTLEFVTNEQNLSLSVRGECLP
ncbi:MAG: hypothetical protein JNM17_01090 [Archangium sp.]|nr:hypothetical protein [Archangium sp.]